MSPPLRWYLGLLRFSLAFLVGRYLCLPRSGESPLCTPLPIVGAHPTAIGIRGPLRVVIVPPSLALMFGGSFPVRFSAISGSGSESRAGEIAKEHRQSYDRDRACAGLIVFSAVGVTLSSCGCRCLGRQQCAVHRLQLNLGNIRVQASGPFRRRSPGLPRSWLTAAGVLLRVDGYFLHNDSLFPGADIEQPRCQLKRDNEF